jgi:hypothetical protein
MRPVLALLVLLGAAAPARAGSVGRIAIFADEALTTTGLVDDASRIVDVFIAHVDAQQVTGAKFMIQVDPGFTGEWLFESSPWYPYLFGSSLTGASVYYAQCLVTDTILIRATYWLKGTSSPCAGLHVVAHPDGQLLCIGCNMFEEPCGVSGALQVNCPPLLVNETTWGRVKALYR